MNELEKKEYSTSEHKSHSYHYFYHKKLDPQLSALVRLACLGHYPLFISEWISQWSKEFYGFKKIQNEKKIRTPRSIELSENQNRRSNFQNVKNFDRIWNQLNQHKNFDKKRVILLSLSIKERNQFLDIFFKLVESRIHHEKKHIQ
jgi:hypothetical protein